MRRGHLTELHRAHWKTVFAALVAAAVLGGWALFTGASLRSPAFFLVGLTLLWAGGIVVHWWRLRAIDPAARVPDTADAARTARAAALRHAEALAARPARLTYALAACILIVGACQLAADGRSMQLAGLMKPETRGGEWWRLLTAPFLHLGPWHLWMNLGALRAFGPTLEAYAPRSRLPLVFLAGMVAGSASSLALLESPSAGASGGLMAIVGYAFALARGTPGQVPPWLGRSTAATIGLTAYLGIFGFAFIDNAAHAGGLLIGIALGIVATKLVDRDRVSPRRTSVALAFGLLGWMSAVILVASAALAAVRLLPLRIGSGASF